MKDWNRYCFFDFSVACRVIRAGHFFAQMTTDVIYAESQLYT